RREQHRRAGGEGGKEPQRRSRVAEDRPDDPEQQLEEGRMVDVPRCQAIAAGEVVELVTEVAVAPARRDLKEGDDDREDGRERCAGRRRSRRRRSSGVAELLGWFVRPNRKDRMSLSHPPCPVWPEA